MKISFIGSGRVATHLAIALQQSGHQIQQIYSPNLTHAQQLAIQVHAGAVDQLQQLDHQIDLLIIAVKDQAIAQVVQQLPEHLSHILLLHTSGSTNLQVLQQQHERCGVLYPLQTFSFEKSVDWQQVPLLLETSQPQDLTLLQDLAQQLSSRVYVYSSAQRLSLHLAAVFACNFSNYCYDMAKQVVDDAAVDFSLLYPLILETAQKATEFNPKDVQTGPAVRQDQQILQMHQDILQHQQRADLAEIYQQLSHAIQQRHIEK
ncbi:Rossmann-like and DUF2520 domain-containing protein [Acinetobacter sp. ANC 4641]|uniref:Rossmann-like and DUF2520 domain-containing protein n=1 Tax=Acinetobacter sp. ANC 4641 TaxID=2529847 RepID=UPI00103FCADD|nr:Rossmann-like and DUF2520 domain-containing protein [Acinetobacter sp. ANC 4641]TCB12544.1 DUF2520 domain-containing protein [Acinetobacter sp. ANC 4641]